MFDKQKEIKNVEDKYRRSLKTIAAVPEDSDASFVSEDTIFMKTVPTVVDLTAQMDQFKYYDMEVENYYIESFNSIAVKYKLQENLYVVFFCKEVEEVLSEILMVDCEVKTVQSEQSVIVCNRGN